MKVDQIQTKKQHDLSAYLTLHISTSADEFIEVYSKEDLMRSVRYALTKRLPYFIIGGGSNIAIKQSKFPGLVIKNSYISSNVIKETRNEILLQVSSGYPMQLLVDRSVENGWEGFEYHKGLPGTLGGSIYMNSKWTRPISYVSDCLVKATLIDKNGQEKQVNKEYFNFSYGYSSLQVNKEIILDGVFCLRKTDPVLLQKRCERSIIYRKSTQPSGVFTCGCFFKNINEDEKIKTGLKTKSAGYLIEACGFKGFSVGNFEVSKKHANFIINNKKGKCDPNDLLQLVTQIKQKVYSKFGIELKEEVVYLS